MRGLRLADDTSVMSYELSIAGGGGGERHRSAFHIGYVGVVGASRRRLAQPELLVRDVITHGSAQLCMLGRLIRTGAAMAAVFQEDLKNTSRKIFDPQDRILLRLNRSFPISCIIYIAIDLMFFYRPRVREEQLPGEENMNLCIGIDDALAFSTTVVRTLFDIFLARIVL
jgi:cyclic nucleotide gated channel, plant